MRRHGQREKRIDPANWAGLKPFGIGEGRPNNYREITKAIRDNRDELPYAWRILRDGVCDGCALGTIGMRDWTIDEVHLCNVRLRLLRLNTMPALDSQRAGRRRDIGTAAQRRAAGPRPAALPDGAPPRRPWLHPHQLGRGARPGRSTIWRQPRPTGSAPT